MSSADEPAGRIEILVKRSGHIVGLLMGAEQFDRIELVIADTPMRDDPAWNSRFALPMEGPEVIRCDVRVIAQSRRFAIEIEESLARRHAYRTAQLVLWDGEREGAVSLAMPAPGDKTDVGAILFAERPLVHGRVVDSRGKPIAGASILLRSGSPRGVADRRSGSHAALLSGSDGQFVLPMRGRAMALMIEASGYLPRAVPWISSTDAAQPETLEFELTKVATTVRGRIVVVGMPVAECRLALVGRAASGCERAVPITLDEHGVFSCNELGAGGYRLRVQVEGASFTTHALRVEDRDVDIGTIEVDLRGRIAISDVNGALRAGDELKVVAQASFPGREASWKLESTIVVTDSGPAMWAPLPIGAVLSDILVTAPERLGRQLFQSQSPLTISDSPETVEVSYVPVEARETLFRALLRQTDGTLRPLRLCEFEAGILYGSTDGAAGSRWWFRGTTSDVGEFRLPVAASDRVSLTLTLPGWGDEILWSGAAAEVPHGSILFEEPRCSLTVLLSDVEGAPLANTYVQVIGGSGGAAPSPARVSRTVRAAWTDSDGVARFGRVPRGWHFEASLRQGQEGGYQYQYAGRFRIPDEAGADHLAKLRLPGRRIIGRALGRAGMPLGGRVVFVRRQREGRRPLAITSATTTSATGMWSFDGVPDGTYELALVGPDAAGGEPEAVSDTFTVEKGMPPLELRFSESR